jgi:hypothetical protein
MKAIDLRPKTRRFHLSRRREVVTGIDRSMRFRLGIDRSSLGIAPKGSTDMSHYCPFDRSNGEPIYELLGEISLLSPG